MDSSNDQQSTNNRPAHLVMEIGTKDGKKSRVRFNEQVLQRSTLSLDDYSNTEIKRCFLSEEELVKTMDRIAKVAQRMESGKQPRLGSSYRGLENATVDGGTEFYYNVEDVVESVLLEQERQYNEGFYTEDLIAGASEMYSEVPLSKALKRAKSDAREAKRAYRHMADIYSPCTEESCSSFSCTDDDLVPILKTGKDIFLEEDVDIIVSQVQPMRTIC
ncbi:MAG: hypothetical protein SGBAC_012762 [Bacillariaceae sp.]